MTIHSMLAESFSGSISSISEIDTLVVDIVQDGSWRHDDFQKVPTQNGS